MNRLSGETDPAPDAGGIARDTRAEIDRLTAEVGELRARADGLENVLKKIRTHPILVTSMPKSGTYFISNLLSRGLAVDKRIVSHQYFPDDTIRFHELKQLKENGEVAEDHFGASRVNLAYLTKVIGKVNVHVRDPRQATLSYVHFLSTFDPTPETFQFIYPDMPERFFEMSLSEKLDWGIDAWLPLLVEWTQGWVSAESTARDLQIRFTRFEDMIEDTGAFVDGLLEFFQVPRERFFTPALDRSQAVHFRKGEMDEWKREFTSAQAERAKACIPEELAERFGWER